MPYTETKELVRACATEAAEAVGALWDLLTETTEDGGLPPTTVRRLMREARRPVTDLDELREAAVWLAVFSYSVRHAGEPLPDWATEDAA